MRCTGFAASMGRSYRSIVVALCTGQRMIIILHGGTLWWYSVRANERLLFEILHGEFKAVGMHAMSFGALGRLLMFGTCPTTLCSPACACIMWSRHTSAPSRPTCSVPLVRR